MEVSDDHLTSVVQSGKLLTSYIDDLLYKKRIDLDEIEKVVYNENKESSSKEKKIN